MYEGKKDAVRIRKEYALRAARSAYLSRPLVMKQRLWGKFS